jgi:hypothetical protein
MENDSKKDPLRKYFLFATKPFASIIFFWEKISHILEYGHSTENAGFDFSKHDDQGRTILRIGFHFQYVAESYTRELLEAGCSVGVES